jgi:hypothetical protein
VPLSFLVPHAYTSSEGEVREMRLPKWLAWLRRSETTCPSCGSEVEETYCVSCGYDLVRSTRDDDASNRPLM